MCDYFFYKDTTFLAKLVQDTVDKSSTLQAADESCSNENCDTNNLKDSG